MDSIKKYESLYVCKLVRHDLYTDNHLTMYQEVDESHSSSSDTVSASGGCEQEIEHDSFSVDG